MKVLITGICGFTGHRIAESLLDSQAECSFTLIGLDNLSRPGSWLNREALVRRGVKVVHGDIRHASDVEAVGQVDWIIDAAANPSVLAGVDGKTSSRQLVEHNLIGTINLLEMCRASKAGFTLLSTSRVYSLEPLTRIVVEEIDGAYGPSEQQVFPVGFSPRGVTEDFAVTAPISLYGATKLASETLALEYGEAFGFPVWINRCGVLAGPGQFGKADQGIFSFWINSWIRRRPLCYIGFGGGGYQVRDCLDPRDLTEVLWQQIQAADSGLPRILNFSGGVENSMSLHQLSFWCRNRFGDHAVDADLTQRPFDIPWMVLDSQRAEKVWNWKPKRTLAEILEDVAEHAREHLNWLDIAIS